MNHLERNIEIEEFLEGCKKAGFNKNQIEEVRKGFGYGLSLEQVSVFAKSPFSPERMYEIRKDLEHGIPIEQAKLYGNVNFDEYQFYQVRCGVTHGLKHEEVALFAKNEFNDLQMEEMRLGLEHGLGLDKVKTYADSSISFQEMRIKKNKLIESSLGNRGSSLEEKMATARNRVGCEVKKTGKVKGFAIGE